MFLGEEGGYFYKKKFSIMNLEKFHYDNKIVKYFANATAIWGLVGMMAGLWAAITEKEF